jgi:hypothetical protein
MAFPPNTHAALEGATWPSLEEAKSDLRKKRNDLANTIASAAEQQQELLARGEAHEAPTTETPPHLHFFDIPAREEALRVATQLVEDVERIMNMKPP